MTKSKKDMERWLFEQNLMAAFKEGHLTAGQYLELFRLGPQGRLQGFKGKSGGTAKEGSFFTMGRPGKRVA